MEITRRSVLGSALGAPLTQQGKRAVVAPGPACPLIPLLWTQGQDEATIRRAVGEVAESGNTGFVWESRPHPDYLGEKWWADLGAAIDEASKRGLEVWIFDEWMYPSGVAGGKVVQLHPEHSLHTVEERSVEAAGGTQTMPGELTARQSLVSVTAIRKGAEPVELPLEPVVRWSAPGAGWRVVWCVVTVLPALPGWSMANMIDVMNPAATAEFLRLTHDATYARFKQHFGRTVKGFFSDETGFRNVLSYESLPGRRGMPMPWSPVLAELFKAKKGYRLEPRLAALWHDVGPDARRVRHDFVDVCATALAENFFKPQREWCKAHGVRFIGHLVEDNHADHNLGYGPGHWFRSIGEFDMPGIDVVGYQVTPGVDAGGVAWSPGSAMLWDQEHFQFGLPAMARGAAVLQQTREIMSEAFGAYGWSQGLRMLKRAGDWHTVNGIAVISPHAFTMKYNDTDCPAHFNRMGGNPQWRQYGDWAREFRLHQNIVLTTDPQFDAAVLYPAESAWAGPAQKVGQVVRALETSQISTAVLPYEALGLKRKAGAEWWTLNQGSFGTVVLPMVRFVPAEVLERLADLADAKVRVLVCEAWPIEAIDARENARMRAALARLQASPHVMLAATAEIAGCVRGPMIELEAPSSSLMAARRFGPGGAWLLLHNRSLAGALRARLLWRMAQGVPQLLEAHSGEFFELPHSSDVRGLHIDLDIPAYGLWAIRLSDGAKRAKALPAYRSSEALNVKWEAAIASDDTGQVFGPYRPVERLGDWRRWPGQESYAGTVRYRARFELSGAGGPLCLDAGRVEEIGELRLNGQALGVRLSAPYAWEISAAARKGANEIELDVTNTAFARWRDGFSHGDAASGLYGPVRILRV